VKPRPFTLLSTLSLLLFLTTAPLCVRSYFANDRFPNTSGLNTTGYRIDSWWGCIFLSHVTCPPKIRFEFETPAIGIHRPPRHNNSPSPPADFQGTLAVSFAFDELQLKNGFGFQYAWFPIDPAPLFPGVKANATAFHWYVRTIPYWSLLLAEIALPLCWLWAAYRRRTATTAGLCPTCRYDLRATPHQCPECGTLLVY
jgi:hypothetical protein